MKQTPPSNRKPGAQTDMKTNPKAITQTRPFQCHIPEAYKAGLIADSKKYGHHYGVFFDTSGKARTERVNPNAQYGYLFRTDTVN